MLTTHIPKDLKAAFCEIEDSKVDGDRAYNSALAKKDRAEKVGKQDLSTVERIHFYFTKARNHYETGIQKCNKILEKLDDEKQQAANASAIRKIKIQLLILKASFHIADTDGMMYTHTIDTVETAKECNKDLRRLPQKLKAIVTEFKQLNFLETEDRTLFTNAKDTLQELASYQKGLEKRIAQAAYNCAVATYNVADDDKDQTPEQTEAKLEQVLALLKTHAKFGGVEEIEKDNAAAPASGAASGASEQPELLALTTPRVWDQIINRKIITAINLFAAEKAIPIETAQEAINILKRAHIKRTELTDKDRKNFNAIYPVLLKLAQEKLKEAQNPSFAPVAELAAVAAAATTATGDGDTTATTPEMSPFNLNSEMTVSDIGKDALPSSVAREVNAPNDSQLDSKHSATTPTGNATPSNAAGGNRRKRKRLNLKQPADHSTADAPKSRGNASSASKSDPGTAASAGNSPPAKRQKLKPGTHTRLEKKMKANAGTAGADRTPEKGTSPAPALRTGKTGRSTGAPAAKESASASYSPTKALRLGFRTTGVAPCDEPAAAPIASPSFSTEGMSIDEIKDLMTRSANGLPAAKAAAAATSIIMQHAKSHACDNKPQLQKQADSISTLLQQQLGASPNSPSMNGSASPIPNRLLLSPSQQHRLATGLCKVDEDFKGVRENRAQRNDNTGEKHDAVFIKFPHVTLNNQRPDKIVFVDFDDTIFTLQTNTLDRIDEWVTACQLARENGYHFVMLTSRKYIVDPQNNDEIAAVAGMDNALRKLKARDVVFDAKICTDRTNDKIIFMREYAKDHGSLADKNFILVDNNYEIIAQARRYGCQAILYQTGNSASFEELYSALLPSPSSSASMRDEDISALGIGAAAAAAAGGSSNGTSSDALSPNAHLFFTGRNKNAAAAAALATAMSDDTLVNPAAKQVT